MFTHIVLFWLKEGTPDSVREAMIKECQTQLTKVPGVRHLSAGRAAMTPRPVVDNSYDVGLCVILDDAAAHDAYQVHPLHKGFAAHHKEHWQRIQVYDFK
jgi:hypothetical protein